MRVWLHSDAARGRFAANEVGPEPLATLSRLLDPAAGRNNDAMMRLGKDQQRLMDLVRRMGIVSSGQPNQQGGDNGRRDSNRPNRSNRSGK